MSDSRNAAKAIPRNYAAASIRRRTATAPAIQFLNTSIPSSSCPSAFHYLVFPVPHLFFLHLDLPVSSPRPPHGDGSQRLLPSTSTHTRAVTDSADILVPSILGISLLSNVRPSRRREPSWPALMDDEGKERVIAERLSLSDSRVLSFGRERKKRTEVQQQRRRQREEGKGRWEVSRDATETAGDFESSIKKDIYISLAGDRCSTIIDLRDERGEGRERGDESKVLTRSRVENST